ncbi:MAG: response regulator [Azoarcus sp.]|jgi:putative two-component system response regulator|nr:response regulator [Azoarcus sp.]
MKMENKTLARRARIILVDDDISNLTMGKEVLKERYEVYPLSSAIKLFEVLEHIIPDMILLDIEMPEMGGYEAMRRLQANERLAQIPVIFITAKTDEGSELKGLSLGAIDYVYKPFSAPLLRKRIETHLLLSSQRNELALHNSNLQGLVQQHLEHILCLQNVILCTVADLVEFRDTITGGHSNRTREYLRLLIDGLTRERLYQKEVSAWNQELLLSSSLLHDVGKIAINDAILKKPGKLTPEEFEIMKTHVKTGIRIIERIEQSVTQYDFLNYAKVFIATHHEKWDGTGYPLGLQGKNIPLEGRLMSIVDVYDALVSRRTYKPPFNIAEASRTIIEGSGTHFDPLLVDIFQKEADGFAAIAQNNQDAAALAA